MPQHILIYILMFFALLGLEALYVRAMRRRVPAGEPVTGAGVVFVAAVWLGSAAFGCFNWWFLAAVTLVGAVSYLDDLYGLTIWVRLVTQTLAVLMMYQSQGLLSEPLWLMLPVLIVAVGFINAYNFMDGIDGITGLYTLAVMLSLWYVNHFVVPNFINGIFIVPIAIGVVVFLMFNLRHSLRVFAGDVGSITLGAIIAYVVTALVVYTADFVWLLLISVYGADTILTLCRRIAMGHNLGTKHHLHLYQRLTLGRPGRQPWVALAYALTQLAVSVGTICVSGDPQAETWYFVAVVAALALAYFIILHLQKPNDNHDEKTNHIPDAAAHLRKLQS